MLVPRQLEEENRGRGKCINLNHHHVKIEKYNNLLTHLRPPLTNNHVHSPIVAITGSSTAGETSHAAVAAPPIDHATPVGAAVDIPILLRDGEESGRIGLQRRQLF